VSDLAKWKVHGQVRSVKTSFAEWDLAAEEWRGPRYHKEATFLPNGKLDEIRHFNPDGTIVRTKNLYDEGGLLIETQFWKDDSLQNQTLYTYDEARRHVRTVSSPATERSVRRKHPPMTAAGGKPLCASCTLRKGPDKYRIGLKRRIKGLACQALSP